MYFAQPACETAPGGIVRVVLASVMYVQRGAKETLFWTNGLFKTPLDERVDREVPVRLYVCADSTDLAI
jgi:hypothetical protein